MGLVDRLTNVGKRILVSASAMLALSTQAYAQFGNIQPVTELNSIHDESNLVISRDDLRGFLSTDAADPPPGGPRAEIYELQRAATTDPWMNIRKVVEANTASSDQCGTTDATELTLIVANAVTGTWDLYQGTRPSLLLPFGLFAPITNLSDPNFSELNPTLSFNGLELHFEGFGPGGANKIWRVTKAALPDIWDPRQQVSELDISNFQLRPVIYWDGKQIMFGCDASIPNDFDICYARRDSPNPASPWTDVRVLSQISSVGYDDVPLAFVGVSKAKLYFKSNRLGGSVESDIYSVDILCPDGLTPPTEVSAPGATVPLYVVKDPVVPGQLIFFTEAKPGCVNRYNVYENAIGSYGSTNQLSCGNAGIPNAGTMQFSVMSTRPSQFFVISGSNVLGEGSAGSIPSPQSCGPF